MTLEKEKNEENNVVESEMPRGGGGEAEVIDLRLYFVNYPYQNCDQGFIELKI